MERNGMVRLVFWKADSACSEWTGLDEGVDRIRGRWNRIGGEWR